MNVICKRYEEITVLSDKEKDLKMYWRIEPIVVIIDKLIIIIILHEKHMQ